MHKLLKRATDLEGEIAQLTSRCQRQQRELDSVKSEIKHMRTFLERYGMEANTVINNYITVLKQLGRGSCKKDVTVSIGTQTFGVSSYDTEVIMPTFLLKEACIELHQKLKIIENHVYSDDVIFDLESST